MKQRVYCLSIHVILRNCRILQFLIKCTMCPPCCWTTHS